MKTLPCYRAAATPVLRKACALARLLLTAACISFLFAAALPHAQSARAKPLDPAHLPLLTGGDISLLTSMEQQGTVYKDHGKPEDLIAIFKAHGCNCMRLRLWVHPSGQGVFVNDLPYTVALGKRIKDAGMYLLLDLHYSDTWADPGKQFKPAAWANLPFDQLTQQVHDYSEQVIETMRQGGAMPDIVQVGNEITGGMLWPDGKTWGPGHDFKNLGILLKAGIQGIKDGSGRERPPLIMIHIDRGGDWKGTQYYFDNLNQQGVPFDLIGESFYPFFQGKVSQLAEVLNNTAERYHKPIIVAETGYPYRTNSRYPPNPTAAAALSYPQTPEGQADFLRAVVATVKQTPDGLGRGVIYWEPEWLPTKSSPSWNTTALFDDDGNVLPGLDALAGK